MENNGFNKRILANNCRVNNSDNCIIEDAPGYRDHQGQGKDIVWANK